MVFSTDQVRQLYVAKVRETSAAGLNTVGDIYVGANDKNIFFEYYGFDGVERSDLIPVENITYAKAVKTTVKHPNTKEVVLATSVLSNSNPVAGDYILTVAIRQYVGMSDEDTANVFGEVHTNGTMTASDFYKNMALSLAKNFTKLVSPMLKVQIATTVSTVDTWTDVTPTTTLSGTTYTKIRIVELEQPWVRGTFAQVPVYFDVTPSTVIASGDYEIWGTVTSVDDSATSIYNSKNIADLEYFCMGERGDVYRNIGWPNVVPTKYVVTGTETYGFHLIEIEYFYAGDCEDVQKSKKHITIAVPAEGATTYTVVNNIIGDINTAAGSTIIATLS